MDIGEGVGTSLEQASECEWEDEEDGWEDDDVECEEEEDEEKVEEVVGVEEEEEEGGVVEGEKVEYGWDEFEKNGEGQNRLKKWHDSLPLSISLTSFLPFPVHHLYPILDLYAAFQTKFHPLS